MHISIINNSKCNFLKTNLTKRIFTLIRNLWKFDRRFNKRSFILSYGLSTIQNISQNKKNALKTTKTMYDNSSFKIEIIKKVNWKIVQNKIKNLNKWTILINLFFNKDISISKINYSW